MLQPRDHCRVQSSSERAGQCHPFQIRRVLPSVRTPRNLHDYCKFVERIVVKQAHSWREVSFAIVKQVQWISVIKVRSPELLVRIAGESVKRKSFPAEFLEFF